MKHFLFLVLFLITKLGTKADELVREEEFFPHDLLLESAQTEADVPAPMKVSSSLRVAKRNRSILSQISKRNDRRSFGRTLAKRSYSSPLIPNGAQNQATYSNDAANTRNQSPTWKATEKMRICPTSESSSWQALAESSPILRMCFSNEDCANYLPEEGPACCSHPFCICATIYPGYQRDFDCVNS